MEVQLQLSEVIRVMKMIAGIQYKGMNQISED